MLLNKQITITMVNRLFLLQDPRDKLFCKGGSLIHYKSRGNWSNSGKVWASRKNFHQFLYQYYDDKKGIWKINLTYIVHSIILSEGADNNVHVREYSTTTLENYIIQNKMKGYEQLSGLPNV